MKPLYKYYTYCKEVKPVIDQRMRFLCLKPYINHPKGCPNFNKRDDCPLKTKRLHQIFSINFPIFAIWNIFNFKEHTERMRLKHPEWSIRQIECCLYWQGRARKRLKIKIESFKRMYPDYDILYTPEACGINITETMKQVGIILEWPPKLKTYQIVLAGINL